jgi:hypothetical protein
MRLIVQIKAIGNQLFQLDFGRTFTAPFATRAAAAGRAATIAPALAAFSSTGTIPAARTPSATGFTASTFARSAILSAATLLAFSLFRFSHLCPS